jgi:hypothetical protein
LTQPGGSHVTEQAPLEQSVPTMQIAPGKHTPQTLPPQSASISVPFLIPSVQVGAAH